MKALEESFHCSTICSSSQYFTFSKVGNGPPMYNCSTSFEGFVSSNFTTWGLVIFLFSQFIFLGFITTFLICCLQNPQKTSDSSNNIDHVELAQNLIRQSQKQNES